MGMNGYARCPRRPVNLASRAGAPARSDNSHSRRPRGAATLGPMRKASPRPAAAPPDPPRVAWRKQMRERVLDEARALACSGGWDRVTLAELAVRAQVSRPSVYKEFGDRAGVGEALVRREADRFLVGVGAALESRPDSVSAAFEAGVRYALAEAAANPLIGAVLNAARGGSDALLPFLTARYEPVFSGAQVLLLAWLSERFPGTPRERLTEATDLVVRMTISHVVLPGEEPALIPQRLARAAVAVLGVEP